MTTVADPRDVIVAPVVAQGATTRQVYLPGGCWELQDGPEKGRRLRGRGDHTVEAPLLSLPYFFRCGTRPF